MYTALYCRQEKIENEVLLFLENQWLREYLLSQQIQQDVMIYFMITKNNVKLDFFVSRDHQNHYSKVLKILLTYMKKIKKLFLKKFLKNGYYNYIIYLYLI